MRSSCKFHRFGGSFIGLSVLLGILLCLGTAPAWSQATSNSSIAGLVTDEQGAAIPAAAVRLLDPATGSTQNTVSNEAGRYVFAQVTPATYTITVTKEGFAVFKVNSQKVDVGLAVTVNAVLKVGSVSTTVEVAATVGAELQTSNAAIGTTLNAQALQSLPNLGRDVATLAVMQPGTTPSGQTAGAFSDQNVFTLDGGNNSDDMAGNNTSYVTNFTGTGGTQTNGSPSGIIPTPIESIEEFRVSAFNQTADFSGSIGGQIIMVTKRGTNAYHGSAYGFYYGTNVGAANTWTADHTPFGGLPYTPIPSNHRTRFGGSLGGVLLPKFLGGKTYFFVNYEGSRFPNVSTFETLVPSQLLRAGIIQIPDANNKYQPYNINPFPVTVGGQTYQPALCGGAVCDPRSIGLNPVVNQIWQKYMPLPNDPAYSSGDQYNTMGYLSSIRAPLTQNSYVARIDHDLGDKHRLFGTYRYTKIVNLTTSQVDIGGALPGDTLGQPTARAPRPQLPSFMVIGLTSTLKPTLTNDVRFNYTRNFWQWGGTLSTPQLPGLGGAVEIGGESASALIPYNVNSQSVRQRFWDGQDKLLKDDLTWLKGTHVFQFGGMYQRNFDYHDRSDNGQGINNQIVYQVTSSNTNFGSFAYPTVNSLGGPGGIPSNQQSAFNTQYSYVLGLVAQSQLVYTRSGKDLTLGPIGSFGFDQSIVPSYNLYASDTWHVKPSVTLAYGISYMLEMPPYELNGKQVSLTDASGNRVLADDYLAQRKSAALSGQVYNPVLGFALTPNLAGHQKYPYDPFYGGFSPRFSVAWNPKASSGILGTLLGENKTVLRAGYGRIYGRLNGVNLLLVPLLPPGLLQAVSCTGPSKNGSSCLLANGVDPSSVFRIGVDGNSVQLPAVSQTLAQPYLPGVGTNAGASDVNWLDPHYRPERTDNLSVTVQRQINNAMSIEVGYVGRIIRNEMLAKNLDAVPYMTTVGGQSFAAAYAQAYFATPASGTLNTSFNTTAQPFFETALGGTNSSYCTGYANCTSAVIAKNTSTFRNASVSDLWTSLYKAPAWTLPRSMISQPFATGQNSQGYTYIATTGDGYGNYNAMFLTYHLREWKGISGVSNFTWGRALGTGTTSQATSSNTALDVYNNAANYGIQSFDFKFIYNFGLTYTPKIYTNQHGLMGRLLGGWTISPLFAAQSGGPLQVTYSENSSSGRQAFGEVSTSSSATSAFTQNAQAITPYTSGTEAHYNLSAGVNGVGGTNPFGVNMFSDPSAVLGQFRKCILGFDSSCGGYALRGLSRWNMDAQVTKNVKFRESIGADFSFQFTNVLNHTTMGSPALSLTTPTQFGRITGTTGTPRQMEFGLRLHF
jgi:hypothetical protein